MSEIGFLIDPDGDDDGWRKTIQHVQTRRSELVLSPDLAVWVCASEDGATLPDSLPPSIVTEARRRSALADRLMIPVPPDVLKAWLALMAANYAVQRIPTKDVARWWAVMTDLQINGMPVGVFTPANLSEICLHNTFLPVGAQMIGILSADRDQLERRANALQLVAGRDHPGIPDVDRTGSRGGDPV